MSNGDTLVELRAWRDEFARSHGYDLHAMGEALREMDKASGQTVIRGEPRRPVNAILGDTNVVEKAKQPTEVSNSVSPKILEGTPTSEF